MKISVQQRGGFAGDVDLGAVDTATLSAGAAAELEQLAQRAVAATRTRPPEIGADLAAQYVITVTDRGREETYAVPDDGSPETEPVRALVQSVSRHRAP